MTTRQSSPESSPTASSLNESTIEAMLLIGTNDGAKLKDLVVSSLTSISVLGEGSVLVDRSFFLFVATVVILADFSVLPLYVSSLLFFLSHVFVIMKGLLVAAASADGFANWCKFCLPFKSIFVSRCSRELRDQCVGLDHYSSFFLKLQRARIKS